MKTLQQSLKLRAVFQEKITAKKSAVHQEIHQALGDSTLTGLASFVYEFKQAKNQLKGSMGEWGISAILQCFPDTCT